MEEIIQTTNKNKFAHWGVGLIILFLTLGVFRIIFPVVYWGGLDGLNLRWFLFATTLILFIFAIVILVFGIIGILRARSRHNGKGMVLAVICVVFSALFMLSSFLGLVQNIIWLVREYS